MVASSRTRCCPAGREATSGDEFFRAAYDVVGACAFVLLDQEVGGIEQEQHFSCGDRHHVETDCVVFPALWPPIEPNGL